MLCDVRTVAGCMPGAEITEQVDATHYKGNVKVKVGPANAAFGGDIEVRQLDAGARTLQLSAGCGPRQLAASMELTAIIEPGETPAASVLVGNAAVIVNGKFAQFGGRMTVQVSDMLLAQFVDNFRAAAAALPALRPRAFTSLETTAATSPQPRPPRQHPLASASESERDQRARNLWALIKGWFAGLFGKRR